MSMDSKRKLKQTLYVKYSCRFLKSEFSWNNVVFDVVDRLINLIGVCLCSEVIAAESVSCLNKALYHLKDIWEEIGIPEDQRLQRTNVVKNHIKVIGLTVLGFHDGLSARQCTFLLCVVFY